MGTDSYNLFKVKQPAIFLSKFIAQRDRASRIKLEKNGPKQNFYNHWEQQQSFHHPHTPTTRVCASYRTPLGCNVNLIRSDHFIYPSRRSAHSISVIHRYFIINDPDLTNLLFTIYTAKSI